MGVPKALQGKVLVSRPSQSVPGPERIPGAGSGPDPVPPKYHGQSAPDRTQEGRSATEMLPSGLNEEVKSGGRSYRNKPAAFDYAHLSACGTRLRHHQAEAGEKRFLTLDFLEVFSTGAGC